MKMTGLLKILGASVIGGVMLLASAHAAQEESVGCQDCAKPVYVSGEFRHLKMPKMSPGDKSLSTDFREEIVGTSFTVTIPDLDAGTYLVEFQWVERFHKNEDCRIFDITRDGVTVATNIDIVRSAGGPGRVMTLTTVVEHPGDSLRGPLTYLFTARKDQAKFDFIRVKTKAGRVLADPYAGDFVAPANEEASRTPEVVGPVLYRDPGQSLEVRLNDLIRRMSLAEKVSQMMDEAAAIPRLGVPAYGYWNECLHGVGRAGIATVFPQAIGLAAMWDEPFHREVAEIISTEARAKHHEALRKGIVKRYTGLTFWSPNINIFRDPRWGRGQETYGEDPFLTAKLGVAFIQGLQGSDPQYLKVMACAKHFAVHSGPEPDRHYFDAVPPERDYWETYLPQFEAAVREGGVMNVMGAYNRLYGEPACSSSALLTDLLRKQWGFKGHVVSDCGAISDIYSKHHVVATPEEASARAVIAGCDLACDRCYRALPKAVKQGLITEKQIDAALARILEARFRLGMFDPPARVPYASIPFATNDCPKHQAAGVRAAEESMVLLKNKGVLPLIPETLKRIAVIGANADDVAMMYGNYNGTASHPVSLLEGIRTRAARSGIAVDHAPGVPLALSPGKSVTPADPVFVKSVEAARAANIIIYIGGISPRLEGEEMKVSCEGFAGGDRTRIELPACQTELLKALHATGKPVIFVNCSGSAIAMPWEAEHLPVILQAWYPGQAGGEALANILFGSVNPAGRLPVTFYRSTSDLPAFSDYAMTNRTYRYFHGTPLFAFGHGLSYTTFEYGPIRLDQDEVSADGTLAIAIAIRNTGSRDGDEVVQVYQHRLAQDPGAPLQSLCGFKRVFVPQGKTIEVSIPVPVSQLRHWDTVAHRYVVESGKYELRVGASSDDIRGTRRVTVR